MIIRTADQRDAAGIAKVQVDTWRSAYAGIVADDYLAKMSYSRSGQWWENILFQKRDVYVAEDHTGRIVGFASGGKSRDATPFSAEVYALYILKHIQRQGLGRQLIATLAAALAQQGHLSLMIGILAKNPSRGFYEALGGQYVFEKDITIGDTPLKEVFYGWPDIHTLFDRAKP